jgi:hypothetical protein
MTDGNNPESDQSEDVTLGIENEEHGDNHAMARHIFGVRQMRDESPCMNYIPVSLGIPLVDGVQLTTRRLFTPPNENAQDLPARDDPPEPLFTNNQLFDFYVGHTEDGCRGKKFADGMPDGTTDESKGQRTPQPLARRRCRRARIGKAGSGEVQEQTLESI